MEYSLRHMPRRGKETVRNGVMFGPYLGSGVLRMDLNPSSPEFDPSSFLFVNGREPKFWIKDSNDSKVRPISQLDSLKPLVEGMNQTAFDLLMPFVFWDGEYEGSGKVAGRPAHLFSFTCPPWITEQNPSWQKVTLALDDAYEAPLRIEFLGKTQIPERSLILRSFKKLDDRWIVKEIDCRDRKTRSVTRMKITSAALGLDMEKSFFLPEALSESIRIEPKLYLSTE